MDVMPILISFFSYGFIQDCIRTFKEHLPNQKILVIDNNPDESRNCNLSYMNRKFTNEIDKFVLAEREWLYQQKNVIVYKPNSNEILHHGRIIDYANEWCRNNGIDLYVHLEPDCLILGRKWYDDLISTIISEDLWIVSGDFFERSRSLHLTPSVWRIDKATQSFATRDRVEEFHKGVKFYETRSSWHRKHWDTGALFVADCNAQGKAKLISTPDFKHLWQGSLKPHPLKVLL